MRKYVLVLCATLNAQSIHALHPEDAAVQSRQIELSREKFPDHTLYWIAVPEDSFKKREDPAAALDRMNLLRDRLYPRRGTEKRRFIYYATNADGHISHLNARNRPTILEEFRLFRGLRYLEWLDVGDSYVVTDTDSYDAICSYPALKMVRIFGDRFAEEGIKKLGKCPHLEYLHVDSPSFRHFTTAMGDGFKSLKTFICRDCRLTDASAKDFALLRTLEDLDIEGSDFTKDGLRTLSTLPNLRVLDVSGNLRGFKDDDFAVFASARNLEVFTAIRNGLSYKVLTHIQGAKGLKSLGLAGTPLGRPGAQLLEGFTEMEELAVPLTLLDDGAMDSIVKLKKMRTLDRVEQDYICRVCETWLSAKS